MADRRASLDRRGSRMLRTRVLVYVKWQVFLNANS